MACAKLVRGIQAFKYFPRWMCHIKITIEVAPPVGMSRVDVTNEIKYF